MKRSGWPIGLTPPHESVRKMWNFFTLIFYFSLWLLSDQSKFSCLKVKGPNYQQSNRDQKKIFNKIKTGEEEQFLSRCKIVNHLEHLVLLWNVFKWLNQYISSRFYCNKLVVKVSARPRSWGTLAFMPWLLPNKVGIHVELLGQISIRRRTVDNYLLPLSRLAPGVGKSKSS